LRYCRALARTDWPEPTGQTMVHPDEALVSLQPSEAVLLPSPDAEPTPTPAPQEPPPEPEQEERFPILGRARTWIDAHPKLKIAVPFLAGFVADAWTLGRIDNRAMILQQGGYLVAMAALLVYRERFELGLAAPSRWFARVWAFHEDAFHFLLGGLLSAFSLFYLTRASALGALVFAAAMFGLLVANELRRFRRLGPLVRVGLFALCLTSYLAYVLPILFGFMSAWLFVLAVVLSGMLGTLLFLLAQHWGGGAWAVRRMGLPFAGMQVLLLLLYFARVIPPLPMAMKSMGIYHAVEKEGTDYRLSHQRPRWRFWHTGDQRFLARPGDRVYLFVRVFAPTGFEDGVVVRWEYDDPQKGWTEQSHYRLSIVGGREAGYRGYAYKGNYRPGDWRVHVETADGRVIGSLGFELIEDPSTEPRAFLLDLG